MKTNTIKHHYILGFCAVVIAVCIGFAARSTELSTVEASSMRKIQQEIQRGALLIDVSSRSDFEQAHAKGAINLPLDELGRGGLLDTPRSNVVYIQSSTGVANDTAIQKLKKADYMHITNLGSVADWSRLGGEVISNK